MFEFLFFKKLSTDDPEVPRESQVDHRKFLNQIVNYKEVVSFSNESVTKKIHQTFKIQYLKDGIFPKSLVDDPTNHTLSMLINQNNQFICSSIHEDEIFLTQIFEILQTSSHPKRRDAFKFLQEFVNILKTVQIYTRNDVYQFEFKFF
jgi:hypothetical protein